MLEFGTITLYREKSVVHNFEESMDIGLDDDVGDGAAPPVMDIRSNRVTMPVKTAVSTVPVIIRGQNIPTTMRMAAIVLDEIRRDQNVMRDGEAVDWYSLWRRKVSRYEADYMPQAWVSVHVGGNQIFTSREDNAVIAEIESLAVGDDVTDMIVQEAVQNVLNAIDDYAVEHDSQTSFVLSPGAEGHRSSILERRDRKTGACTMSVKHPTPQTPVRLAHFLNMNADVMELLTLKSFLDRIQEMAANNTLNKSNITPTQIQGARARRQALVDAVETFEDVNKVVYRPERPKFA